MKRDLEPKRIAGGSFTDERGTLQFVNDFDFKEVRRFYRIKHPNTQIVRAWQVHSKEKKYFMVTSGSFAIATVAVDNFEQANPHLKANIYTLKASKSEILEVPGGFANGLKALEQHSEIMVMSNFTLDESAEERITFPKELWVNWDTLTPINK